MRRALALLVLAIGLLAVNGVSARIIERIIAVVDQEIILQSELESRVAAEGVDKAITSEDPLAEKHRKQAFEKLLWRMIDDMLVKKKADEMQLRVSEDEVERTIDNVAVQNNITRAQLYEAIRGQGLSLEGYRRDIQQQLLRHKVMSLKVRGRVRVSDEEARRYYNDQVRGVRARDPFVGAHILVKVPEGAGPAVVAERRAVTEEILRQIQDGRPFDKVAKAVSEDPSTASAGGVIGEQMPGTLHPELDRAFLDLEPGEVGGPVRTERGFHILRLLKREASQVRPFAEVRDQIKAQLIEREMKRQEDLWIDELRRATFVDVRL